ncbi:CCA tRNA nucleotidyltransferase [Mangrovibacillus sp. Mu-81]|jgi:tRNA nucleotidyltransferase (CCA-adding enzyme)|uniref:CCA tRNA nucleotidyltransferase n=1 Tax=Mangrovibacillus sp. Mu-81 TaxID=3121478 RepID=UPI002FE4DE8F
MLPTIFQEAIPLIKRIEEAGFQAYFVGGSVRDYLLGRPINDVDIATSAFPDEIKSIFPRTADIGIQHGTVLVIEPFGEYEITTFRTESEYRDFRRPDQVEFIRSLEGDLKRRDFTMNSLAMDADGVMYDPFQGQADIKQRIIRTVGAPSDRFSEDALRMLRGIRFVSQLGFDMEPATRNALKLNENLLTHIAVERKTMEFEKMMGGEYKDLAIHLLLQSCLFKQLPGLADKRNTMEKIADFPLLKCLSKDQTWLLLLACIEERPAEFLKEWKLPSKMIKERTKEKQILSIRTKEGWTKELLYQSGLQRANNVEKVYNCLHSISPSSIGKLKDEFESLPIKSREELNVTGRDLMQWTGRKGGPWIKEVLGNIEMAILHGEVRNEHEMIRRWIETCSPSEKN